MPVVPLPYSLVSADNNTCICIRVWVSVFFQGGAGRGICCRPGLLHGCYEYPDIKCNQVSCRHTEYVPVPPTLWSFNETKTGGRIAVINHESFQASLMVISS
jgi:hypothetical protein